MKIKKTTTHLWIKQAVKLVQSARQEVVKHTNSLIVVTYFHLGKLIVEQEQKGSTKATYGQEVIKKLSDTLTKQFGKGFSDDNLENMRLFYLLYKRKTGLSEISETVSRKSLTVKRTKSISASKPLSERLSKTSIQNIFPLSWSHYVTLIRIKNKQERAFYEIEARQNNWSVRELKRQYDSGLFERLLISKDKKKVRQLAAKGQVIEKPEDVIKSKYILEFLGMEEAASYTESEFETAIINKIEQFLLEMGKGFLFGGRQVRFSFDDEDFYVDLVLYNRLLQCFVLVDLKIGKLKHQDIGQMQMYVNYYDRYVKKSFEKPTVGIIICKDKSDAIIEITLPADQQHIFAKAYKLYLPTKTALKTLLTK
ncbi:PDDEXK nuclease domain-containing protein [Sediminibacterium goheungense]|uniref:Putative nuclease of restriction endonuclease-like (RecB) superfamily n=1 Tax=Sediminibacterium goheungense TaxID=1086393 RepID=A0A4R6IW88_9BACT|nr:PDDEXK nuclease domain-containing protein [Sediminibacterium goheungense]TDO26627.1 putative nuclease of restriction endonuclease-like (RecB) superfamily [Sediminibacterium goheungense]